MAVLVLLALLVAAVLFALATFGLAAGRVNLIAAGLLAFTLAFLLPAIDAL